jgi:cytochrome c-type biogenesis protein CcmH/NrfG
MPEASGWTGKQVYVSAAICLALGVSLGYLFRGSGAVSTAAAPALAQPAASAPQMPSLQQMKEMALKQAEPLLAKLKNDPKNAELLAQVGGIYEATHQFKDAVNYYERSLAANPKNVLIRNEMATCLYYMGDVDAGINQLERVLKDDPKNANALFNLGMIRWQAKKDPGNAVSAWKQLLKLNPELDEQKKAQVNQLISDATQRGATQLSKKNPEEKP